MTELVAGRRARSFTGARPPRASAWPFLTRTAVRVLGAVGVLWGAATLTYAAVYLTPGDPAYAVLGGPDANPTPEALAAVREQYGMDRPWWVQYLAFLGGAVTGDLGESYQRRLPVTSVIAEQAGATVQLAVAAGALAVVLAVASALLTANRRPAVRGTASAVDLTLASLPSFWLGILLLSVFSYRLGWLPAIGNEGLVSLVLPALTLALPLAAVLAQVVRNVAEETFDQPFVVSARARGLSDTAVRLVHVLRHSLISLTTMAGFLVAGLLGGAVITETLYSRQGLGRTLLSAVSMKDMPLVVGLVVLSAAVYVLVNLIVDLLYPLIDPRLGRHA
jgi:peptide/nickel transport system permease protein